MFNVGRPDAVRASVNWRTHHIPPGDSLMAVSIGPPVCPLVHWTGDKSTPCLKAISGGELLCSCDQEPRDTRRIAYYPMLTGELERVVVILSNRVAHQLGDVPHGQVLRFTRTRVKCAPLAVAKMRDFDIGLQVTRRAESMRPQDIREYLLHLWSVDVLSRWCAARSAVQTAVANLVEAADAARDTVTVPSPAPASGAAELRARLRRARKPSG